MEVGAVRKALAEAVRAAIPSLTCYGYQPDSITPPAFCVGEVEVEFDRSFGRGLDEFYITCRLFTGRGDDKASQELLDRYLSGSGPYSVKAAIEATRGGPGEPALNGLAADVHVQRVQAYRYYQIGSDQFFGAELLVHVIGSG